MKRWFVFSSLLLWLAGAVPVFAAAYGPQPPQGFELILEQPGVWLYRKDYAKGTPDYVQVVNLAQGANVRMLYAPVTAERPGRGAYGGSDARLGLNSLEAYWGQASAASSQAFCVTNGQFFYMPEAPTRLALPLKVDGQIISEGFGYDQYPEILMLELWADHADISLLTADTLYASSAPHILGGLPEDANKRAPYAVGRTFIGLDDWDSDGMFEVLYILTTPTASQEAVAQVLRDFGADKVMMLDGGGSTQLICQGESYIPSERNIPQAIAVLAAPQPLLDAQSAQDDAGQEQAQHYTLAAGEKVELSIRLQNTGADPWLPGVQYFILEDNPLSMERRVDFEEQVLPGEWVTITLRLASYSTAGRFRVPIQWRLETQGKVFARGGLEFWIDVLPTGQTASDKAPTGLLSDIQAGARDLQPVSTAAPHTILSGKEKAQSAQLVESFSAPALAGLHEVPGQPEPSTPQVPPPQPHLADLMLIPLLMLPVFLIVFAALRATQ